MDRRLTTPRSHGTSGFCLSYSRHTQSVAALVCRTFHAIALASGLRALLVVQLQGRSGFVLQVPSQARFSRGLVICSSYYCSDGMWRICRRLQARALVLGLGCLLGLTYVAHMQRAPSQSAILGLGCLLGLNAVMVLVASACFTFFTSVGFCRFFPERLRNNARRLSAGAPQFVLFLFCLASSA